MPHLRNRHAIELFEKLQNFSPVVGIFGHRQVGKTTFLEQNVPHYRTLDQNEALIQARYDSANFLSGCRPLPCAVDEAQLAPELFPALKEWVRSHKRPGQFVLSGSVRFSSRTVIRESLTGRIMVLELLPLVLSELKGSKLSDSTISIMARKSLEEENDHLRVSGPRLRERTRLIEQYLACGGLPGVCFIREARFREDKLREQLNTILDRDIRLVYPTTLTFREIENYVRALASEDGEILRLTKLRAKTRVSEVTQKKLLHALEAVFVIRLLPLEGDRKGLAVVFEDQAEVRYLNQGSSPRRNQLANLLFRNIRAQFSYVSGGNISYFQFRTRGGVIVPIALRTPAGELGLIACEGQTPSRKDLFAAQSFIRHYGSGKCLLVTFGNPQPRSFGPRILQIPAERLLFGDS